MDGRGTHLCALMLLLVALTAAAVAAPAAAAPVPVSSHEQLVAAITTGQPSVVLLKSVLLKSPLPNITRPLTITGALSCLKTQDKVCRIDGRRRFRHFTVVRGGVLSLSGIMLSKGNPKTGSGGSLWLLSGARAVLDRVYFRFNGIPGTTSSGGAIEVNSGARLQAHITHFIRNYAGFGGAISGASRAVVTCNYCIFHRNAGSTAGGAISLILGSNAVVRASKFYANTAGTGSIFQLDSSSMLMCNPDFYNNNSTLPSTAFLATQKSSVTVCGVPPQVVKLQTGATLKLSCANCAPPKSKL